jgi:hypothetical protein
MGIHLSVLFQVSQNPLIKSYGKWAMTREAQSLDGTRERGIYICDGTGTGRGSNWSFDTFHDLPMPLLLLLFLTITTIIIDLLGKENTRLPLLITFFHLVYFKMLSQIPPQPVSQSESA